MAPLRALITTIAGSSLLLLSLSPPVAADKWGLYPTCTRPILDKYAPAACWFGSSNPTETYESNACLCPNQTFVRDFAGSIFKACGCNDLEGAASTFTYQCDLTKTPAAYNYTTIIAIGSNQTDGCVDIPTTTPGNPTSTSTPTTTPTITPDPPPSVWNAGVIVGTVIGGLAALAGVAGIVLEVTKRLMHKPEEAPSHIVMNFIQNNFVPGNAVNAVDGAGGGMPLGQLQG